VIGPAPRTYFETGGGKGIHRHRLTTAGLLSTRKAAATCYMERERRKKNLGWSTEGWGQRFQGIFDRIQSSQKGRPREARGQMKRGLGLKKKKPPKIWPVEKAVRGKGSDGINRSSRRG